MTKMIKLSAYDQILFVISDNIEERLRLGNFLTIKTLVPNLLSVAHSL